MGSKMFIITHVFITGLNIIIKLIAIMISLLAVIYLEIMTSLL